MLELLIKMGKEYLHASNNLNIFIHEDFNREGKNIQIGIGKALNTKHGTRLRYEGINHNDLTVDEMLRLYCELMEIK